ncbi:unnamed protein product [Moneuplotes crassus]|uniref:Uncharacterized protein n=1 Tax=Euplotes crassus TaxID=5936 RepID=A0AAD1UAE6_EUPCR|nr:unnamed protein product [Moneuplotes crassus]
MWKNLCSMCIQEAYGELKSTDRPSKICIIWKMLFTGLDRSCHFQERACITKNLMCVKGMLCSAWIKDFEEYCISLVEYPMCASQCNRRIEKRYRSSFKNKLVQNRFLHFKFSRISSDKSLLEKIDIMSC